eukprot:1155956-Pelagomonas_calceolata.AAC.13
MAICWMILMPVCRACGVRKSEKQERGRLEKGGKGGTVLNTALAFKSMDAKHVTAAGSQAHFSSKKAQLPDPKAVHKGDFGDRPTGSKSIVHSSRLLSACKKVLDQTMCTDNAGATHPLLQDYSKLLLLNY